MHAGRFPTCQTRNAENDIRMAGVTITTCCRQAQHPTLHEKTPRKYVQPKVYSTPFESEKHSKVGRCIWRSQAVSAGEGFGAASLDTTPPPWGLSVSLISKAEVLPRHPFGGISAARPSSSRGMVSMSVPTLPVKAVLRRAFPTIP